MSDDKIGKVSKNDDKSNENIEETLDSNQPSTSRKDNFNKTDSKNTKLYNIEFGDSIVELFKNSKNGGNRPSTFNKDNIESRRSPVEVFKYSKAENNSEKYLDTAEGTTSKNTKETEDNISKNFVLKDHSFLCAHIQHANQNSTATKHDKTNTLEKCTTMKDILSEILDCKVVQKPSTSNIEKTRIPEHQTISNNYTTNRTVKEILGELLDYTICRKSSEPQNNQAEMTISIPEIYSGNSVQSFDSTEQSRSEMALDYKEVYRTADTNIFKSKSATEAIKHLPNAASSKSLKQVLPSYSTVMKMGPNPLIKPIESCISFIPRPPPPTYAEVEGIWEDRPSMISSDSLILGPDPIYMVCPRCRIVIVTNVERENSNMTHLIALILCVCFCWPFCLVPYCLKSCSYSYHTCPNCQHYFGMYRPF